MGKASYKRLVRNCEFYLNNGETPLDCIERLQREKHEFMNALAAEIRRSEGLLRGEFICQRCGIRMDAEMIPDSDF